ncbi:MAG: sigma-70 family RNA polymerase sigma factor [Bacteroidales bacterium]|nr:sigma-70 family RNA polymerase sigma factor [Bacteroidales bacterium]
MENKEKEFETIVRENKSTIYTVCYMFSKDNDEVNDLFQEVLINLWNGFDNFRGESKVGTWIWRVALNTCISDERKKRRHGEKVSLEMASDLFADDDHDTKQIQQLYGRINRLDLMERAIVLLWLDNLSYDEIAAIVGITVKNVSVKLLRIKQKLIQMSNNKDY